MRYNINMKTVVITILLGVLSGFYILRPEATPVPVNNPVGIPEVKELEKVEGKTLRLKGEIYTILRTLQFLMLTE